ncbi:NAD(P)/FAD-dependent oxidoreductase [Actinomadura sp. LOL_016]|uniref:NAD(P)/FAD-dependent oxidoreductase n=1 Tax=unclassified Actinomadura TaxID=2626254 RepID=UPI003A803A20
MSGMADRYDVVIVGAGHGGVQLATALTRAGYSGSVALIGDEPDLPYERPPLSKGFLAGTQTFEEITLRSPEYWADSPVQLIRGTRVTRVEAGGHEIVTAGGARIGYGRLVWAAGGTARALPVPGAALAGVHAIRTAADTRAVRGELPLVRRAVIVGGGYVGLETAAALKMHGMEVTVVEAQDRLLARVTSPVVSGHMARVHRNHGVEIRLDAGVRGFGGSAGRVRSVCLDDGAELPADLVIVGVGLRPNVDVLAAAGAVCSDGVDVDERCRTSLDDISAIGDCARQPSALAGGRPVRLESVQNAGDQARIAASDLLGEPAVARAVPWFWSHQYDVKLKTAGLLAGYDTVVLRGDPAGGAFSAVYLADGRVIAVDSVNSAADFAQGKTLVGRGVRAEPDEVADTGRPLKALLKRT